MGRKVAEASAQQDGDDDTKVVDEIESLCMNCHENVRRHAATEPARLQF
jgi:zinc finger protein